MAGVFGKSGGAYATINRSPNYMGEALSQNADLKYKYDVLNQDREQKKGELENTKAKLKADIEKERKEDYKLDTKFSGLKSVDEVSIVFANEQAGSVAKAHQDYDSGIIDNIELQKRISRAKNNINLLSTYNENLKTGVSNFQTAIKEGKAHPAFLESTRGLQKDLEFGKVIPVSSPETGELLISRVSKNERGEEINEKPIGFSEFATNIQKFIPNIDFLQNIENFKKVYVRDDIETYTTNKITGVKELTPRISEAINSEVTKSINNDDELSVAYYDATGNAEENITDEAKKEVAKNYLEQKYLKAFGIDKTIKINTSIESLEQKKKQDAIDNTNKDEDQLLAKAKENRITKAQGKTLNRRANGSFKPTFDDVYTTGVEVISNETFEGAGNTIPKQVKVGAKVISIDGMETYGANKLVKSKLTKTFINPDGSIVMVGNTYDEKGGLKEEDVVWDKNEDQLEFINSVTKDYDNNGNPVNFETINNFKKHVIDKTGVKINTKPKSGVGSKYNN